MTRKHGPVKDDRTHVSTAPSRTYDAKSLELVAIEESRASLFNGLPVRCLLPTARDRSFAAGTDTAETCVAETWLRSFRDEGDPPLDPPHPNRRLCRRISSTSLPRPSSPDRAVAGTAGIVADGAPAARAGAGSETRR